MEQLRITGEQLIETVAYGDAAGLPVETAKAADIHRRYGWLGNLASTHGNPYYQGHHEAGTWSDDTQLTIAVAEALIDADGFDLRAQAEAHIKAFNLAPKQRRGAREIPLGWGGSTTQSVIRLMRGIRPEVSGEPEGAGNGVLMKMAPLAYWQTIRGAEETQRYAEYDALTRMTHDSPVALAVTRLHGDVLSYLLEKGRHGFIAPEELADYMLECAARQESLLPETAGKLTPLLKYLESFDKIDPAYILLHTDGEGFYVPQTVAMAYGAFLHNDRFPDSVWTAVNLGGDTDSIASIVGVMSLFAHGQVKFPGEAELLQDRDRLRDISRKLARAALLRHNT